MSRGGPLRFRNIDIGDTLGRYHILEELGTGGMAIVYRARDSELKRDVAVKVLLPHLSRRPESVARFQREARAAAALDHGNIVRVYDVGGGGDMDNVTPPPITDPPYLVMELIEGLSLETFARTHAPIMAEIVACIGAIICEALAVAHDGGIIHRDIKPANIMITNQGRIALADFGLARIEGDDGGALTKSGALLGTPAYMAPEQAHGDTVSERSDLYALGVTLYRLAAGSLPYTGSPVQIIAAIVERRWVPPQERMPSMGTEFARIIERLMAPAAEDRFASAKQAADTLRDAARAGLGPAIHIETEAKHYFADPGGYTDAKTDTVVEHSITAAETFLETGATHKALAAIDRVLNLQPECPQALALIARISSNNRRIWWVSAASLALAASAFITVFWLWPLAEPTHSTSLESSTLSASSESSVSSISTAPPTAEPAPLPSLPLPAPTATDETTPASQPDAAVPAVPAPAAADKPPTRQRRPRRRIPAPADDAKPSAAVAANDTPPDSMPSQKSTSTSPTPPPPTDPVAPASPEPAPAPAPVTTLAAAASATLRIDIKPWCNVRIDGVDHGRAQRNRDIRITHGLHEITCSQGPGRPVWRQRITVQAGETRRLTGNLLNPVRTSIALQRGDRVRINGQHHANGTVVMLAPGRHRITVLAGERAVAAAWVAVPNLAACTLRDVPDLDCYRNGSAR